MCKYNCYMHVYSLGADNAGGQNIFKNVFLFHLLQVFPFDYFVADFPIQTHRGPNLTLTQNRSRSHQSYHLYKL